MKKTKLSFLIAGLVALTGCGVISSSSSVNSISSDNSSIESSFSSINSDNSLESSKQDDTSSSGFSIIGGNSRTSRNSISSQNTTSSSSSTTSSSKTNTSVSYQPSGDTTWNININLRGNAFRDRLETLISSKRTRTISYNDCLTVGAKAAAYPKADSSTFIPFYHEAKASEVAKTSECNREHTWPNSRGSGKSGAGADPYIIRPTLTSENSSRGNSFYGISSGEWDPASCGFEGARGESARVILYAATAYHSANGFELSNNPGDSTSMKTMGTLKTLIEWNKNYPVTNMEKQINDYLDKQGLGRNPFVDHPEFADYIWNSNGIITSEGVGETGQDDFVNGLNLFNNGDIDGKSFAIVSSQASSGPFFALNNKAKSDSTPWYLEGISVLLNSDKSKMITTNSNVNVPSWTFTKTEDGLYTIYNAETRSYLTSSINDTHYNIGLSTTLPNDSSGKWDVSVSGSGYKLVSGFHVYFEYYQSSFCGYKNLPGVPVYFYSK